MLVWKVQTLNLNVASLRYRCLLPLRYLAECGVESDIYGDDDPVKLTPHTEALIFVKSFYPFDVETCKRAHRMGIPIIIDICDNIFIDEYSANKSYVLADNFRLMAEMATAVVATGSAMKAEVEAAIVSLPKRPTVVIIPDGSESISDIAFAIRATRRKRLIQRSRKLLKRIRRLSKRAKSKRKPKKTSATSPSSPTYKNQPAPLRPYPWPLVPSGTKTVLWFGNHGAKYGNFGMLNILDAADALQRVAQDCPLRLLVISNSRDKYEAHIAPLPFATDYLPWHPRQIYAYIRESDVVIIPNSRSRYSICKSANRAVLALSQGTPVIASATPALDMLEGCVWLDDWEGGLRAYLTKPQTARTHVQQAQSVISQQLSGQVIAQKWLSLLDQIKAGSAANDASNGSDEQTESKPPLEPPLEPQNSGRQIA